MCHVWCVMCDLWCEMCDMWCVMCDLWYVMGHDEVFTIMRGWKEETWSQEGNDIWKGRKKHPCSLLKHLTSYCEGPHQECPCQSRSQDSQHGTLPQKCLRIPMIFLFVIYSNSLRSCLILTSHVQPTTSQGAAPEPPEPPPHLAQAPLQRVEQVPDQASQQVQV